MTHEPKKSDLAEVAMKPTNKAGRQTAAESVERRAGTKGNANQQSTHRTQIRARVSQALGCVRQAAKARRKERFTALLHHVNIDLLRLSFYALRRDAAPGVDGVRWQDYEADLESNLQDLHARVHRGAYRAKPSRRKYLPKPDGRQRPLGIAALEDKVLQRAVVAVLSAIYEEDFLGFSYGFRPKRSQHDALDALIVGIDRKKVNWILDLDVRDFFGTVSHAWLIRFMEHRIGDERILRLIRKWLKAGVLEDGVVMESEEGTPQGASVSPLLANIYLHYILDLWAQQWRKRHATGDMIIVRFADDGAPRRRGGEFYVLALNALKQPCCTRDEGGPLEPGLQDLGSNHRMLLRSNGRGGERDGKGRARPCQVSVEKTSESKPPMNCRKRRNDVKTRGQSLFWDQLGRNLFTAQATSGGRGGVSSMQALVWNVGTCASMRRKQLKRTTRESLSTDAGHRGGVARSSEEGSVMGLERRGDTVQPDRKINRQREESFG